MQNTSAVGYFFVRDLHEKLGGLFQSDGEGFSNEEGAHILWQFDDDVAGPWKMAILQGTRWQSFMMDLENKGQRRAFLEGQLVKGGQMLGDLWFSAWQQATEDKYLIRNLTERKAASTPSSGACGVVRILAVNRRSPTSSATSVNVPPMSTPSLTVGEGVTRERSSHCLRRHVLNRLVAQEGGNPRIALQLGEILRRG